MLDLSYELSLLLRVRITSPGAEEEEVSGTRVGERLLLRIEMAERDSILGMFASDLRALRGDSRESIQLLDDRGCPTEPIIFSGESIFMTADSV